MAITINGSGTITGVSAGGLPDNCITADDLATTLDLSGNTITLPSGTGGKVLQVVHDDPIVNISSSATGGVELFNLSITPSSTSSKILALVSVTARLDANEYCSFDLYRGSLSSGTKVFDASEALFNSHNSHSVGYSFSYLDPPSTTSAINYTVVGVVLFSGQTIQFGGTGRQSITLMEIAG